MLKKHSRYALPISFSECLDLFSKGELLLVKSGEELVSGNLLVSHNRELHSPIVGVSDVDKHLTLGSYSAYYFSILVGIQRGYTTMDFGETPPFMDDGLFQFKRDMGMWIRPAKGESAQVLGVKFSNIPMSGNHFLSTHPFIFVECERLSGLVFLDLVNDLSIRSFFVSGMTNLYVISLNADSSGVKCYKVEELKDEDYTRNDASILKTLVRFCAQSESHLYRITK